MGIPKLVGQKGRGTTTSTPKMCLYSGYIQGLHCLYPIKIETLSSVKLPDSGHLAGSQGLSQFHVDDLRGGVRQEGAGRHF
jgi:hypothetical protein